MMAKRAVEKYGAKHAYRQLESALNYEDRPSYSGLLGALRNYREKAVVSQILDFVEEGSVLLDCPCGNGRWFKLLCEKAESIVAIDISHSMIEVARINAKIVELAGLHVRVLRGDAEGLPLEQESVDYVYSFALMKHLRRTVKCKMLREFARVCRKGVICSFALFSLPTYGRWKIRDKDPELYPIWQHELSDMAEEVGLTLETIIRIISIVGLECVVYLRKKS